MRSAGFILAFSALAATALAGSPEQTTECPTFPQPDAKCTILKNHDRPGSDLKSVKGSVESCTGKCKDTTGCVTWAWSEYEGGTCWLKSAASKPVPKDGVSTIRCEDDKDDSHDNHDSDDKDDSHDKPYQQDDKCKLLQNFDRPGSDLKSVKGAVESCTDKCKTTAGCVTWAWSNHEGGTCWLKSASTKAVPKDGVVTIRCNDDKDDKGDKDDKPNQQDGKCTILQNHDRPGFDFKSVKGSVDSCTASCKSTNGCATWAWSNYEGGTCWLKTVASKPVPKDGVSTIRCNDGKDDKDDKPYQQDGKCQLKQNVDFVGNDIANKPANEAHKCCGICSAYPGCKAYAWSNLNGGTCWLKAGVTTAIHKEGVVSSSIVASAEPVCAFRYDVDFPGNDIGNKSAKDAGECCGICKGNKDCKAYSWSNHNGGTCWMKSGKGEPIKKTGVVSAVLV